MTELGLFLSAFVSVFALGFQTLCISHSHYRLAFLTSVAIGGGQLVLMRMIPDATLTQIAATLLGGPFGIIASMHVHHHLVRLRKPLLCVLGLHAFERHSQIDLGHARVVSHGRRCKRCLVLRMARVNVPPQRHPPIPRPADWPAPPADANANPGTNRT